MYGGELDLYTMDAATGHLISDLGPLAGPDGEILGDMKFGSDGYLYFCGGLNGNVYRLDPMTARTSLVAATPFDLSGLAFYPAPFDTTRPSVTSQPASQVGALGGRVTFSVAVAGTGPMIYQWSNGAVRVQDGSRISGAASPSLTIANLMQSDAGTYVMTVSNAFGAVATIPATLAIGAGPAITVQPAAVTRVVEGNPVTLRVTAAGAAPLLYQWMAGGSIIAGATSRTLAVSAAPLDGVTAPFYTVLVRNNFGVALSAPAEVIVLPNLTKPGVTIAVPAANARTASDAIAGGASANATRRVLLDDQCQQWRRHRQPDQFGGVGPVRFRRGLVRRARALGRKQRAGGPGAKPIRQFLGAGLAPVLLQSRRAFDLDRRR